MLKDNLKTLRNDRGLSQNELAKIMNVSQQTIASWEVGRTEPDNQQVLSIARYFGVSADSLLGNVSISKGNKGDPLLELEGLDLVKDRGYFKVAAKAKKKGLSEKSMDLAVDFFLRARESDVEDE